MFLPTLRGLALALILSICALPAVGAPYAAVVMDARTGEILHSRSADTPLHPASLTKMMTLYLVFNEIRAGRMNADQMITISKHAASQPPSKLGLKPGQRIALRYLIRAAAVKSANDAAMALAEAVAGSQSAFADKMNNAARAMGMRNTHFVNPHGLTTRGHYSSAMDMALLGRRLFYDFPEYYNLFSRRSTYAGTKTVYNTNRRLLGAYEGADGIKTGYTNAAGFNLVSSAQRGQERVIVAMFGGSSSAARNKQVAELMDLGFERMPSRVAVVKPPPINLDAPVMVASAGSVLSQGRPETATRPRLRDLDTGEDAVVARASVNSVTEAVVLATRSMANMPQIESGAQDASLAGLEPRRVQVREDVVTGAIRPRLRPQGQQVAPTSPEDVAKVASLVPMAGAQASDQVRTEPGGPPDWGVQVGQFTTRNAAERHLLTTALQDIQALDGSKRRIIEYRARTGTVFKAQFVGLTAASAQNACARLTARAETCEEIAVGG